MNPLAVIAWFGAVIMVAVGAMLIASAPPARGHSWYPKECCGGNDCAPVEGRRVRVVPGGFLLDGKHFIPASRARPSEDDDYHACFWPQPDNLYCFFIPPHGA